MLKQSVLCPFLLRSMDPVASQLVCVYSRVAYFLGFFVTWRKSKRLGPPWAIRSLQISIFLFGFCKMSARAFCLYDCVVN